MKSLRDSILTVKVKSGTISFARILEIAQVIAYSGHGRRGGNTLEISGIGLHD